MTAIASIARTPILVTRLKKRLENEPLVFIPASVEDYWKLVETPQLRLDYYNHQIVAAMSYGSLKHETIVNNVSFRFNLKFEDQNCRVLPSNRPVYAADCGDIFNPDVHLVQGDLEEHTYKRAKTATLNPAIIVEVMSESTKGYDTSAKLPCYQRIKSVQHIVYIEQDRLEVCIYTRTNQPNEWLMKKYYLLDDTITLLSQTFSLNDIYRNIDFSG
jgi:Uma2 family endonuclease